MALLLLFAVVLVGSVTMQRRSSRNVAAIIDFHLPLAAVIADLDVATDEYELIAERFLLLPVVTPAALEQVRRALDMDKARIAGGFKRADALIASALADSRTDAADRLVLARAQRSFVYMGRLQAPYFALGDEIFAAVAEGQVSEARALAPRFKQFEQAWGADMAELRKELSALAQASTEVTHAQQMGVLRLNLVLFALAVVIGLGLSVVGARHLVRALWRVIEGAKAIESGDLAVTVPVTSRDEIGQLAQAFNSMAEQLRTTERIKDTFGKYVDPRVVARLIDTSKESLDQAERKIATIMFSDLKGFTTISEQLTATAMVGLLNRYFTVVAEQIRAHSGILEKYIGDAVVAFWSAPFAPGDTHAASACLAALAHRDAVIALRPELSQILGLRRNLPDLIVRMGIATGEVVVGTVGAPTAKSFAAIGDTTNLASRLEGVNKVYGTTVIVAEETHRLAQDVVEARELDTVVVVGKSEAVRIFELLGRTGAVESGMLDLRDLYGHGLEAYRRRDWDTAEQSFSDCLQLCPEDGPSQVLRKRIATFRAVAPAPDWNGVWHLGEK
ncbi:MAG TPA: adenylate/guanylate cyclase domain-containing protein [Candidatus Dormibacteraeota bacterium]|nr:adenylate/guanylate cyclase domain-containing protein [Candidatus Dormibacteraeota bacterium]